MEGERLFMNSGESRSQLYPSLMKNMITSNNVPFNSQAQSQTDHSDWENGLRDQIKTSVRQALDARELIKVTFTNLNENIHEVAEILERK